MGAGSGLPLAASPAAHGGPRIAPAPPTLGQHNDYVLREILGLSESEIEHLASVGAIA